MCYHIVVSIRCKVLYWQSVDIFFFFKQKTAYEMRISDWSSDVCSSDLHALAHQVGDETSRAYRRGDALLKRRVVMNDWEAYVTGSRKVPKSKVAKLVRRSAKAA